MKNSNYNLVKLLLRKLDDTWRIEKHYEKDAKESACADCLKILKAIRKNDEKFARLLRAELSRHIKTNVLE
jgi:ribosomal protein L34E